MMNVPNFESAKYKRIATLGLELSVFLWHRHIRRVKSLLVGMKKHILHKWDWGCEETEDLDLCLVSGEFKIQHLLFVLFLFRRSRGSTWGKTWSNQQRTTSTDCRSTSSDRRTFARLSFNVASERTLQHGSIRMIQMGCPTIDVLIKVEHVRD